MAALMVNQFSLRKGIHIAVMILVLVIPVSGTMQMLANVNIPGNDINNGWTDIKPDAQACADECELNSNCYAATYVHPGTIQGDDGHCWLKSAQSASTFQETNYNTTSFVKIASVSCIILPGWKADFSASPKTGTIPLSVSFTDTSSYGSSDWYWSFGDGGTSSQQNPVHLYNEPGSYAVELIVKDNCGVEYHKEKKYSFIHAMAPVALTGSLAIASTPAGAAVTVDGTSKGTTPVTVTGLSAGIHTVHLSLQGYDEAIQTATITAGQTATLTATLKVSSSPAGSGSLQIISTPDGAVVSVDGGSQGITPTTVSGLSAGKHTVKLTKSGYTEYSAPVTVQAGKTTQLSVPLVSGTGPSKTTTTTTTTTKSTTGTGSISVSSSPSGASMNLDGWEKGKTPATLDQVKAGSHTLTLTLAGYDNKVLHVPVEAGKTTSVTAVLVPSTTRVSGGSGMLAVRSNPAGANVYLDGEKVGSTPVQLQGVQAGSHILLLTMSGYDDVSRTIEIASGSDKDVSIDLGKTDSGKKAPGFTLPLAVAAVGVVVLLLVRKRNPS